MGLTRFQGVVQEALKWTIWPQVAGLILTKNRDDSHSACPEMRHLGRSERQMTKTEGDSHLENAA